MAYKQVGKNWHHDLSTTAKKYIVDSEADIANLPKCATGSFALVANGGAVYVVNASGEWSNIGSGASALAMAEGVLF